MIVLLWSKSLLNVFLAEPRAPINLNITNKQNEALLYLSSKINDAIYTVCFPNPKTTTPHQVWTHLKERYAATTIYSLVRFWNEWDKVHYEDFLVKFVNQMEEIFNDFKMIEVDVLHKLFCSAIIARLTAKCQTLMDTLISNVNLLNAHFQFLKKLRKIGVYKQHNKKDDNKS